MPATLRTSVDLPSVMLPNGAQLAVRGAHERGILDGEKPKALGAFSPDALTCAAFMATEMMRCAQVRAAQLLNAKFIHCSRSHFPARTRITLLTMSWSNNVMVFPC